MAKIFVEKPHVRNRVPRPVLNITIEPEAKAVWDASLSFKDKHGFGFMIRTEDAVKMATMIRRVARTSRRNPKKPTKKT